MLTLIIIGAVVLAVAPWRRLEAALCRRAYGIPKADVDRGYVELVRDRHGRLIPAPGPRNSFIRAEDA